MAWDIFFSIPFIGSGAHAAIFCNWYGFPFFGVKAAWA
jgi:hypothetical protein